MRRETNVSVGGKGHESANARIEPNCKESSLRRTSGIHIMRDIACERQGMIESDASRGLVHSDVTGALSPRERPCFVIHYIGYL